MTHDLLSIKLCQLDDQIGKLHSRIYMSETAGTLSCGMRSTASRENAPNPSLH